MITVVDVRQGGAMDGEDEPVAGMAAAGGTRLAADGRSSWEAAGRAAAGRANGQGGAEAARRHTLVFMTYGKCVYWTNGRKHVLEKGDALLIAPGTPFYGKRIPTVFHDKYVVSFARDPAFDGLPLLNAPGGMLWRVGGYELMHERFKALHREWTDRPAYYRVTGAAHLLHILAAIGRERDRGAPTPDKLRAVELMREYIHNHYREKVTKEQLGRAAQRSPNHAATLFRAVTGQTISEYVHAQRMKTALYLLSDSLLTVGEIAEYLGYGDASYFYRVFKRTFGCNPADYA